MIEIRDPWIWAPMDLSSPTRSLWRPAVERLTRGHYICAVFTGVSTKTEHWRVIRPHPQLRGREAQNSQGTVNQWKKLKTLKNHFRRCNSASLLRWTTREISLTGRKISKHGTDWKRALAVSALLLGHYLLGRLLHCAIQVLEVCYFIRSHSTLDIVL